MIFAETAIAGAFVVSLEPHADERGWFARTWCQNDLRARGLNPHLVQMSLSSSRKKGTLRGMHYSVPPHAETKIVRCVRGAIYDVLVDLRPESPTFLAWCAETLTRDNGLAFYVPEGLAHGFQTLEDETDVLYGMSEIHDPACARGVRWNDPAFGIAWPDIPISAMSERDRTYPAYEGSP